jgi:hypothetical protein
MLLLARSQYGGLKSKQFLQVYVRDSKVVKVIRSKFIHFQPVFLVKFCKRDWDDLYENQSCVASQMAARLSFQII